MAAGSNFDYLQRADSEGNLEFLEKQLDSVKDCECRVICKCGFDMPLIFAYRCLYCGEYFCKTCAEEHFGMSIHEWIIHQKESTKSN